MAKKALRLNDWELLAIEKALIHFKECQPNAAHYTSLAALIRKIMGG